MSIVDRIRLRYNDWCIQRNLRKVHRLFVRAGASDVEANNVVLKLIREIPIAGGSDFAQRLQRERMLKQWVRSTV